MFVTRRDALIAVVIGGGLATTKIRVDENSLTSDQPHDDPIFRGLPEAVRTAFEVALPGYWCIRLGTRGENDATVYRATVFHPDDGLRSNVVDGETVTTRRLYDMELDAQGKSLEETVRPIGPDQLPKAVLAAYEKWNPNWEIRLATMWSTELPRGKDRVYGVHILVNQIKSYKAFFKEDGTVVRADPTDKL